MKIGFEFLRQLLELLTSDWQNYLNSKIKKLEELSIIKTNDSFLREECYKTIAYIKNFIKKHEYPYEVSPFNKIKHASFLLTNIHILELDYLNQSTVKAVKNMLQNNFKEIYDPQIYIIANYDEPIISDYGILEKISQGKVITFEDFNIKHENYTKENLEYIDNIINDIRKLDNNVVTEIANIVKFVHQIYFGKASFSQSTILFLATHFEDLEDFYENLDKINFLIPIQRYDSKYLPKNYDNFINIKAVVWNKFLVKYQKLFNNLSEENLNRLSSVCSDNDDLVKLLVSDSIPLNLEKRIDIITHIINKYDNNTGSICRITTQLFNICSNKTSVKSIEAYVELLDQWQGLPINWCYPDGKFFEASKYCKLLGDDQ